MLIDPNVAKILVPAATKSENGTARIDIVNVDLPILLASSSPSALRTEQEKVLHIVQEGKESVNREAIIKVLEKLKKWSKIQSIANNPVQGTRLIPCKTPIDNKFILSRDDAGMEEGPYCIFTVDDLVEELSRRETPLGLIVDLSNHNPLYDIPSTSPTSTSSLLQSTSSSSTSTSSASWKYVKIACVSKQTCDIEAIRRLQTVLRDFSNDSKNEGKYAAIHCSYGRNRTGVVVASYLVEEFGIHIDLAITRFREARPPGIKHKWMIEDLRKRYDINSSSTSPTTTKAVSSSTSSSISSSSSSSSFSPPPSLGSSPAGSPSVSRSCSQVTN